VWGVETGEEKDERGTMMGANEGERAEAESLKA